MYSFHARQLTLNAGKGNVNSMIEEIEYLVSNQVSVFFINTAQSLQAITATQANLFEWNQISASTVQSYFAEDASGNPLGAPILTDTNPGDNTLANPGNNGSLLLLLDGLNFSPTSPNSTLFGPSYLLDGAVAQTLYQFAVNPATSEHVVFANDWTLTFLSSQITNITSIVTFPVFVAVIDASTGIVLGTSSLAPLTTSTTILRIDQINDPFFSDFSSLATKQFPSPSFTQSLLQLLTYEQQHYPGTLNWFLTRSVNAANWKLSINSLTIL
ncbi:hypothetical protein HDU98_000495 [Podochytrium sp. JEL0797]|nr:hypothetical protein HDU98_000495 [Podochytrium sp. JEL0797]